MKNVNIDLLNESESGELTGGFSVVEGEGVSETSFLTEIVERNLDGLTIIVVVRLVEQHISL